MEDYGIEMDNVVEDLDNKMDIEANGNIENMNVPITDQHAIANEESLKKELDDCENASLDTRKYSNIIILGSNGPSEKDDFVIDGNQEIDISSRNDIESLEATEQICKQDPYDCYTDNNKIYKKYRLRQVTKKPDYRIPTINDLPSEHDEVIRKVKLKPEACAQCPTVCENIAALRQHIRSSHKIIFTCSLCTETFKTNPELINHKKIHDMEDRSYLCHKCKKAFSSHCDFLIHEKTHFHQKTIYKCPECGLSYIKTTYESHIYTHFSRMVKCTICSKELTESNLNSHMNLHTAKFKCVECEKVLADKSSYSDHLAIHTGVKMHQCLYCGKAFRLQSQKVAHTRIHTKERPYGCDKCDRKFRILVDLQRHYVKHNEARNEKCSVCEKRFKNKLDLSTHMSVHAKKYKCPECDKYLQTIGALKYHILQIHTDERPQVCELCDKKFVTKSHLLRHYRCKMHKNNVYRTTVCKGN